MLAAHSNGIVAMTVYDETVPVMILWLRGEEFTPAHEAGVVIVKPGGDTIGVNGMITRMTDRALYDTGFRR